MRIVRIHKRNPLRRTRLLPGGDQSSSRFTRPATHETGGQVRTAACGPLRKSGVRYPRPRHARSTGVAAGRWRCPRSPVHARGDEPRRAASNPSTPGLAQHRLGDREWGLRPQAPPPPCKHHGWRACPHATRWAGSAVRACGRRPHSRSPAGWCANRVLMRCWCRAAVAAREPGPENACPGRRPLGTMPARARHERTTATGRELTQAPGVSDQKQNRSHHGRRQGAEQQSAGANGAVFETLLE